MMYTGSWGINVLHTTSTVDSKTYHDDLVYNNICCVVGMELIGPSYRLVAGVVIQIYWAGGFFILIGLGYAIQNWSYFQLTITLPMILFTSFYW